MSEFKNIIPILKEDESSSIKGDVKENDDEYEHPKEKYYFVFLDILGFKKTFLDEQYSMCKKEQNRYDDVFKYYFKLMSKAKINQSKGNIYAGQTSDSLYFYTKRIDYLLEYIKIFQHFNNYAMYKDVFFRGGIAQGVLHFKREYQFYGDSVINAYLLESLVAVNPIVIVDEETYCGLMKLLNDKEENVLLGELKGRYYIKLFNFSDDINLLFDNELGIEQMNKSDILTKIEENIIKNKKKFEYDPHNFNKYSFLLEQLQKVKASSFDKEMEGGQNA